MSLLHPSTSHASLAYSAHAHGPVAPYHHVATGILAARDVVLALVLSGTVIAGVNVVQRYQPVFVDLPVAHSQSIVIPPQQKPVPALTVADPDKQGSAALQTLLDKWQADYPKASFGVVVKELSGAKRSASLNPDTSFEGASLYKLYLADYLYTNIADKVLSPSDHLGSTRTIGSCLDLMIVNSDNECGESIGYTVGWTNLENFVRNLGFSETTETPVNTTTASDVAKYLQSLQAGTLIDAQSTDHLLANMRKQIFRSAIPAGEPGLAVADKVGIKKEYWHDAAIVYGKKGPYILVVLSQGSGSGPIKDLAQRVSDFMND